ncbi:MAG TPA: DMT family transporter, partial [Chitinophagaceae bacterium]|nr:DMT family transporter [Chitinophagaceae bacterium]
AGTLAGYYFKPTALRVLKLSLWCYAFMMLGYFMYFTSLIRSNANPAIDMNNVDNPINLVYYLSREQYGSAPLIYGPHFQAQYAEDPTSPNGIAMKKGEMKYIKTKTKYVPVGTEDEPTYRSEDMQLFPRVWDRSNDQGHAQFYAQWLNLAQDQQSGRYEAPTMGDNLEWFFTYQVSLMYWRYFMWNFAGKQNDLQGFGTVRDGNWISGFSFIDNNRLGDQDQMPASVKNNKAHNKLYMLPFLLGIIGCVYQFLKNRRDWAVTFLLFFLTGIAVVFYLNQPGGQPRERDYAYVGSFYAFAIWIGLAVVALVRLAREKEDKQTFQNALIYGAALTFIIILMSSLNNGTGGSIFLTCLYITALYAVVTIGLTLLLRAISSAGQNFKILNIATSVICLAVPLMMAQQEWDDHDRSKKVLAPDLARDYLESCEKNAILFTFGDNDTYPLWYAQEVEGVRPDIRIINNSLLGIDWYINQLRYKVNQSDSLDLIFTPEQIEGHNREYLSYRAQDDQKRFYDLYDVLKRKVGKERLDEFGRDAGIPVFPVSRVGVDVDVAAVKANGTAVAGDSVVSPMLFEIPERTLQRGLYRSDIAILAIIATNHWKRPIYFTSPFGELGFYRFLRKDGLAYRLVPVENKYPQANWVIERTFNELETQYKTNIGGTQIGDNNDSVMYRNLEKFGFGGAEKKGVYFDEENRRHLLNIRSVMAEAAGNYADLGDKDKAVKLLDKLDAGIDPKNLPYAMVSRFSTHNQIGLVFLEACYKAGKKELAEKIRLALRKDIMEQTRYYNYLKDNRPELYGGQLQGTEVFFNNVMTNVLDSIEQHYAPEKRPKLPTEGNLPPIISNPPIDSISKDSVKK